MFASGYGSPRGDRIVLVEFDPANVVCVPRDSAQQKIRCTVYTVISEFTGELSSYAPILQADSLSDESTPDFDPEGFEMWDDDDPQQADDSPDFCPMCGQELPDDGAINFCPFCGEALT